MIAQKYIEKFWANVCKGDGCWEWRGSFFNHGYGLICVSRSCKLTHRFSWELHYGDIPQGICVCHKCDNPKCVRPDHLFLGTTGENNSDRHAKGRDARMPGIKNGRAKLTPEQVREIRRLAALGVMQKDLAVKFGITNVSDIVRGVQWTHV